MKRFAKLVTKDSVVNRIQDSISTLFDYVQGSPLVGDVSIVEAALSTTPTVVSHKLGRVPQGFIIVDIDAPETPFRVSPFSLLSVQLQVDAPCTAKLLFF